MGNIIACIKQMEENTNNNNHMKPKKINNKKNIKNKHKEKEDGTNINPKKKIENDNDKKNPNIEKEKEDEGDRLNINKNKNKNKEKKLKIKNYEENDINNFKFHKNANNSTILIGLSNIGATCYMNSTLQCLSNTDKLTNYFLDKFKYDKGDNTKKMSNRYYKLLKHLWNKFTDTKFYSPTKFKKALSEENTLFAGENANDSKDLLNFLLERLHNELNMPEIKGQVINSPTINQLNEEEVKAYFFKEFTKNYRSIISDLFYFTIEIKSQCYNCKTIKYNFQVSTFLEFPLEQVNNYCYLKGKLNSLVNMDGSNPDINLLDCFEHYHNIEVMGGENQMYCNCCQITCNALYGSSLYILPEYLIINLNRGKNAVYKCNVNFPEELDLTNYVTFKDINTKFELYAVICHLGPSSNSGHFVAYCRNRLDHKWYLYNDSIVSLCQQPHEYRNGMPYILFYQSKNNTNINNGPINNIFINNYNDIMNNQNNVDIFNNLMIQNIMLNQNMVNQNMINQNMVNQNMVNQNMVQNNMINQNMANQNMINQNMVQNNMINQNMFNQNMINQNMINQNMVNQNMINNNMMINNSNNIYQNNINFN